MANQNVNEELVKIENNEEHLEWTQVEQNNFSFWDDISEGSELIGVYTDDYKRTKLVDDEAKITYSPILETSKGTVVLPEHTILLDLFSKIDHGKLVKVVCTEKQVSDKTGKPKLYKYEVYTLLNKGGLKYVQ